MKYYRSALLCGALIVSGVAYAAAPPLSQMTPAQKQQEQKYFTAHSLEFSSMFKAYHPGPYWILHHDKEFALTKSQKQQETKLKNEMAMATIKDNRALKAAYHKYALDGAKTSPSVASIDADIDAVGQAQTRLAKEMVPFHLKSCQLLDAKQRKIYTSLAAQTLQHNHS
jgi:Spy/CpxP family protein refolding chaperone